VTVVCEDLSGPEVDEACGYQFWTCGEKVRGSVVDYPDFTGNGAGDAMHIVATDRAVRFTATTCGDVTNFDAVLMIWDGAPHLENSTMLRSSDSSASRCAVLTQDLPAMGSYWLVVDAPTVEEEGVYEVSFLCEDLLTTVIDETCGSNFLTCGDSVIGTNVDYLDFAGSTAGDSIYTITVFEATRLTLSVCGQTTSFDARMHLFDGSPALNGTLLATSDPDQPCFLTHDLPVAGAYFLAVGGHEEGDEGLFELTVLCQDFPDAAPVDESCAFQFITCGESIVSTNYDYPDWFGSPSSDAIFLFSVSEPTDVVATTCSSQTSFR
jgi:hypothetical protein